MHGLRKAQRAWDGGRGVPLWRWGRTQATKHVWALMEAAAIAGPQASPKGLRHGFGVRLAMKTRNPSLVQRMLGHASLETTAIYMVLISLEDALIHLADRGPITLPTIGLDDRVHTRGN